MSDYFDNLTGRSSNTDQTIRPRPLSLFESAAHSADQLTTGAFFNLEMEENEPAVHEIYFDREPSARQPLEKQAPPVDLSFPPGHHTPPPAQPVLSQTEEEVSIPTTTRGTSEVEPRSTLPPKPLLGQPQTVSESIERQVVVEQLTTRPEVRPARTRDEVTSAPLAVDHQPLPQQPLLEPVSREIVIERIVSIGESPPPAANDEKTISSISDILPSSPPQSVVEPAKPKTTIEQTGLPKETEPSAPIQPLVKPYIEPITSLSPQSKPTPKSSSTIQVTIGRIEVRATSPPAPPPKKRRSAPAVMSLDEYLRQQTQGGKR